MASSRPSPAVANLSELHLYADERLLAETPSDMRAFGVFYERHVYTVLAVARGRVAIDLAFDVASEVFAAALDSVESFRDHGEGSALAWLLGITRHEIVNHHRRSARHGRAVARLGMRRIELTDAELVRLEDQVDALRSGVIESLDALPEHERAAVFEYVVNEAGYESIAARHGASEAAIRKRVSRGLRRLKRALGEGV